MKTLWLIASVLVSVCLCGVTAFAQVPQRTPPGQRSSVSIEPLSPDGPGDAFRYGGLGAAGRGWGGGGTGEGSIGMGGIGSLGAPSTPPVHDTGRALRARGTTGPVVHAPDPVGWIRAVILRGLPELAGCQERFLGDRPGGAGSMSVRFDIMPSGRVRAPSIAHLDESLRNARFERCVTSVLARWQFAPRGDGVITGVTYPFRFDAQPPPARSRRRS